MYNLSDSYLILDGIYIIMFGMNLILVLHWYYLDNLNLFFVFLYL